jgi:subtilase family serine protease
MPATQPAGSTSNASVPAALMVTNWGQGVMSGASYVGPVTNANLSVTVQVHQQSAAALVQYAQEVNDPTSPFFRKFLTPQEIGQRYGAKLSDYQSVAQYFANNGLSVAGWPQRLVLIVSGGQTNMQKAFGTTFGLYQRDGKEFVAPDGTPHFQQQLPVDGVARLANYRPEHSYMIPSGPRAGAGYATGFSPSTVRAAFDYIGPYKAGYDGAGVTLGIIATGPLNLTTSGFGDVDLNTYASDTNTTLVAHVTQRDVTNQGVAAGLSQSQIQPSQFPYAPSFTTPPAVSSTNPEDGEAQLDTQQSATLAPGANIYFYLGYNSNDGCPNANFASPCPTSGTGAGSPQIGIAESDAEIQQAIFENAADVISISYGGGETQQGWTCNTGCSSSYTGSYEQLEFAALNAEGVAVFASSGDDGSAECYTGNSYLAEQCVSYPAGDPFVTSVGGITTNVDLTGAITAPWLAWGISTFDTGYGATEGSGGGASATGGVGIPAPLWQASALGATSREQPDVSMIGDPSTGVSTVNNAVAGCGEQICVIGGTSVAAPEMAAMWADVLSACKAHSTGACAGGSGATPWRLGNAAPYLYAIYKATPYTYNSAWMPSLAYNQVFYDIVYGDNQMANPTYTPASPVPGASAGPGYDMVTGVGVPYAGHLIQAITGQTVP